jgi:hypothetical protein
VADSFSVNADPIKFIQSLVAMSERVEDAFDAFGVTGGQVVVGITSHRVIVANADSYSSILYRAVPGLLLWPMDISDLARLRRTESPQRVWRLVIMAPASSNNVAADFANRENAIRAHDLILAHLL